MTPEERNLVMDLFNRLATLENAQRDPEAERLIEEGLRYAPKAPYALVQTVLVQDEALKRAEARIRELEAGAAEPRDTGFLGSMRDSLFGRGESRGSVPSVRAGEAPGSAPAWQTGPQPTPSGPGGGPMPPGAGGGSFLGTAAAAAAGVIGGSLLLGGIRSVMGQQGGAHAAHDPSGAGDPWRGGGSGGDLARQVGLDNIGRSPAGEEGGRRGLFDDSRADEAAAHPDADDLDADDFDVEDEEEPGDFDDAGEEE
jgi:uncharacterized protein